MRFAPVMVGISTICLSIFAVTLTWSITHNRREVLINAPAPQSEVVVDFAQAIPLSDTPKSLRIALLGYRSSPFSGGQGIYLRYLSRALAAMGHKVTVISGPPYPHLDEGIELVELPSLDLYEHGLSSVSASQLASDPLARVEWLSKLTGGFAEPYTFAERAKQYLLSRLKDFDVIHDNQTLADGIVDLQSAGIPVVTTIHHPITRDLRHALAGESRWSMRLLIKRWHSFLTMQARVARALDHIVTVSTPSKTDIVADFGVQPSNITVMHNGVDTQLFRPMPEITRKPFQVMATASADVKMKGLHILLPALASLVPKYPELSLLLVGKPKPGGDTEGMIKSLGMEDRVRFISGVDHEHMAALYAESNVAVVPSLYEGFGLPAVEAMACGMPLVSSDGGALGEVVGDGGLLVPAGDITAMSNAIDSLLSDDALRTEIAGKALNRALNHFCWNVCAQRLTTYYRAAMARC